MQSGASLTDEIVNTYKNLKSNPKYTVQAICLSIENNNVNLLNVLDVPQTYEDSLKLLPDDDCRILITNFKFKTSISPFFCVWVAFKPSSRFL